MKYFLILLLSSPVFLFSQSIEVEYQGYPTGNIFGVQYSQQKDGHSEWNFRGSVNLISERTEGEQDIEEGEGFGGSVGYRYYLNEEHTGWFGSFRTDLWFSSIDWQDITAPDEGSGTTDITVVQPILFGGYVFELNDEWRFTPSLGGGVEFNVREDGRDVGEGPITLWGLQIGKRF